MARPVMLIWVLVMVLVVLLSLLPRIQAIVVAANCRTHDGI